MFWQSIGFVEEPIYRCLWAKAWLWTWQLFLMEAAVKYESTFKVWRCEVNRELQAPATCPSITYAKEWYLHDVAVETERSARFIYLANGGMCNDFKRPLQHFVPDVHWVCCTAAPRRLCADERDPMFVYRSFYNYMFLRITGKKYRPLSFGIFSLFQGFATVSSSSSPKNIQYVFNL